MKKENDRRTLYDFLTDVGYIGIGDEKTKQTKFFTRLHKQFQKIKKDEPTDLKEQGIEKIVIRSNIIDIYTRLEFLLRLKLCGHSHTLTEASNLIDDYTNEVKYKTNNNIEMLLINFLQYKWNYQVNY